MEHEEKGDDGSKNTRQDVGCHDEIRPHVVEAGWTIDSLLDDWIAGDYNEPVCHCTVEKHVHEELVVIETNAVGDPRAVMVHF